MAQRRSSIMAPTGSRSASGRARSAPRASSPGSASLRSPRSRTSRRPWRKAACRSSPTAGCASPATSPRRSPRARTRSCSAAFLRAPRSRPARSSCSRAGPTGDRAAHGRPAREHGLLRLREHRRDADPRAVRRDHRRRDARVARARRADRQGSAELPGRVVRDKILILDFGAQYSQLIARRVRESKVYCELHPFDVGEGFVREFAPRGVILSGGPASVYEDATPKAPDGVFELGVPVLGICYGMQTMAAQLGGRVENARVREFGYAEIRARGHSKLLEGIQDRVNGQRHGLLDVWMSHGDKVTALPPG